MGIRLILILKIGKGMLRLCKGVGGIGGQGGDKLFNYLKNIVLESHCFKVWLYVPMYKQGPTYSDTTAAQFSQYGHN